MIPIRLGIVGDTHGDTRDTLDVLKEMGDRKISHVFIVGDVGIWTHFADGHEFLDEVNASAKDNNFTVFAIPGNHENHDHWEWFVKNMPTHKGFGMVRRRVLLAPKVHDFTLAGKQFVVAGGAVSIDREYRLERERVGVDDTDPMRRRTKGTGPRTMYWPNEELTDQDVVWMQKNSPKADILLTHDCSDFTPFEGRLKPDPASQRHRRRIDKVLEAVKPTLHFHGHMHTKYHWYNAYPYGYVPFGPEPEHTTETFGLECNPEAMWGSRRGDWWGVLDTDTMEFAWRGEGMHFRSLDYANGHTYDRT